ncbi:MAG: DUF2939 domain-containing protein [Azoarcus sp.]|nr:DUF2939 domain-containing protein [Azoarcus sp.]
MSTNLRLIAVAALVAAGGVFGYQHYTTTPTYSLVQIKHAIDRRDVARFEYHVDVDSIVSRAVDEAMAHELTGANGTGPDAGEEFGRALGYGLVEMLKPTLVAAAKQELRKSIESGEMQFAGMNGETASLAEMHLAAALQNLGMRDDANDGFSIERRGKIATLHLYARNEKLAQPVTLEFAMRDMGSYWRVVEFANLREVIEEFQGAATTGSWSPPGLR